jgi:hypothetical protein
MRDVVIAVPDEQKVQAEMLPLVARAQALVVTNQEEHGHAQEFLVEATRFERVVVELFETPKQLAFQAHRSICDLEHKLLDPVRAAKKTAAAAITRYEAEERERALAEQLRLQEEARRQAEARAMAEAEAAEAAGDPELAEQVLEDATTAPAPPVYVAPKVASTIGVTSRTVWRAEVTNLQAFVKHVAANPHLLNLIEPNMTALNGMARSLRGVMNIPGVRAVSEIQKAVRAA